MSALNLKSFIIFAVLISAACTSAYRVPARSFLIRGESPQPGFGAYGYLVFTSGADSGKQPRYERVCDSYKRNLWDVSEYQGTQSGSLMVTYWPLVKRLDSSECSQLVSNYDYVIAAAIAGQAGKLSSPGPILIAWKSPFPNQSPQSEGLVLDLSDFSNEDLDRAFGIWKDRIVRDPEVWNEGFKIVKAREAFRNLISTYGDQILAIVKPK